MLKINKIDNEYNNIREININNKKKLRDSIFNKCDIVNEVFYYKNYL